MHLPYYRGGWHEYLPVLIIRTLHYTVILRFYCFAFFSCITSLGRALAHCPRFLTAASKRELGPFSVPMWLNNLSVQLSMFGLVRSLSHQLPNTTHTPRTAAYMPFLELNNIPYRTAGSLRFLHQCATFIYIISQLHNRSFDYHIYV